MDFWDQKMMDFVRRGERNRVHFLEAELKKRILPSQLKRIQQNDKAIIRELVLPKWLDWELLYEWSMRESMPLKGSECILCNKRAERGTDFNGKFICDECFFRIKSMP